MIIVSIYITTKNRPDLLARSVKSVITQSFRDIELIVVDDGSTCDNETMLHALQQQTDVPIRYIRNEQSQGACFSRNLALSMAKGKYITGLDDDDEFVTNRIEQFVKHYKSAYAFIAANDNLIRKNGKTTYTNRPTHISTATLLDASENLIGNQVFTEKVKLEAIGGFDTTFPAFQDFDTFYRLTRQFGQGYIIPNRLQNIYRNDQVARISTLHNQLRGVTFFFLKHRKDMNSKQRKRFILRYRLMKAKVTGTKSSRVKPWDVILYSSKDSLKNNITTYAKNYLLYIKGQKQFNT